MTHSTDLQLSMYVDGALLPDELVEFYAHFNTCPACQDRAAVFIADKSFICNKLKVTENITVPAFQKPANIQGLGVAALIITIFGGLTVALLESLYNAQIFDLFTWLTPLQIPNGFRLTVNSVLYFSKEGTNMIDTFQNFAVFGLFLTGVAWLALTQNRIKPKTHHALSFGMVLLISSSLFSAPSAQALEVRRGGQLLTIEDNEVIEDTLIIAGDSIVINGVIEGDLLAFCRTLIINGEVKGNLITFAQSTSLKGKVQGSAFSFSNTLELTDANIASNLFGFSNLLSMNTNSNIGGNATIFNNMASLSGTIERDLTSFNQSLVLRATVGEDVGVTAEKLNLKAESHINGNLHFRTNNENNLQQSPEATILGSIEVIERPQRIQRGNKYLSIRFYLFQLIKIAAALTFGILLLWIFPGLRSISLSNSMGNLKSAGIGLIALVSLPIIMMIFAITVIGLPLSVMGIFCYFILLYAAKIILASVLGRMLVNSTEKQTNIALTLLAGLVVVSFIINLPWVGDIFNFILVILGIGIIVQKMLGYTSTLDLNTTNT